MYWIIKENIKKLYRFLTTHKCEASGCNRRLEKSYRWCSIECFVYCGGKLQRSEEPLDEDKMYYCVFCKKEHLCEIKKTTYTEDLICVKTKQRIVWR